MKAIVGGVAAFVLGLASFVAPATAQIQLGKEYALIDPPLPSQAPPGKIEVVEFFSYGCPHCNDFNPFVKSWEAKMAADVTFRKVPVAFGRPAWERLSAIYYALEITGDLARLDQAVFTAVHGERFNFSSNDKIVEWAIGRGVDKTKINDALNSFGMQSRIRRGDQEFAAAKLQGVPAVVVAGRYLVNLHAVNGYGDTPRLINEVVALARKELAGKK